VSAEPQVPAEEKKTVIVGQSKPLLNYVTACITMFNSGARQVVLRARGEAINMSVEVAQVLRKRFMSNVQISNIVIDGESVTSRDGRQLNLPVLEIELSIPA
jgi:archaea-specific DNA-binding protein